MFQVPLEDRDPFYSYIGTQKFLRKEIFITKISSTVKLMGLSGTWEIREGIQWASFFFFNYSKNGCSSTFRWKFVCLTCFGRSTQMMEIQKLISLLLWIYSQNFVVLHRPLRFLGRLLCGYASGLFPDPRSLPTKVAKCPRTYRDQSR